MPEGFPTGSAKMPARVLLGAFVISHPQVPRSQDQIPPCFSQNVNGIEDCWRKHNIPTTAVQNMWMLHHGFRMWKNRRASLLPSPPCYWGAWLWSFCVASKHIPTIQQVQQQSNLLYGKSGSSLVERKQMDLTHIPSWSAVNLQAFRWLHFTGYFIHLPSVSPTPKHLFLFQYCRCLAGTLSKC